MWDGNTFAARASWKTQPYRFTAAALSHGGTRLAVATDGDGVLLGGLDSSTSAPTRLGGSRRFTSVAFSEDERWLVAGSAGGQIVYWDLRASVPSEREVSVHRSAVTALRFGGGRLASAALDGEVKVWAGTRGTRTSAARPRARRLGVGASLRCVRQSPVFGRRGRANSHLARERAAARRRNLPPRRPQESEPGRVELYLSAVPYAPTCPDARAAGGRP